VNIDSKEIIGIRTIMATLARFYGRTKNIQGPPLIPRTEACDNYQESKSREGFCGCGASGRAHRRRKKKRG